MRKEQLGLALEYSEKNPNNVVMFALAKVKRGVKSRDFITSPEISEALRKANFEKGFDFGRFILVHDPVKKELGFVAYYPHPPIKLQAGVFPGPFTELGIASALETRLVQVARKYFPNVTHIVHSDPTIFRLQQLMKRGHAQQELERIEINSFEKKLREKRVQELRKARAIKRTIHHQF